MTYANSVPATNDAAGDPLSTKSKILDTGASVIQDLAPVKHICAHLNAFHVYASDTSRYVEANHYCSHLNEDVRQCIIYDSPGPNARLIGIEYMISPRLYETLDNEERKLWHSHVYEVKSGMLVMPQTSALPNSAWEAAETKEMEEVIHLYGKVYHFWQVDKGDKIPLGPPQLMTSFTKAEQFPDFESKARDRDARLGTDFKRAQEARSHIKEPKIHPEADWTWKED